MINLQKQIEILKAHPDFDEVVRDVGVGPRANTVIALLNNGNWFELEFSEPEPGKVHVGYWQIDRPDAAMQKLLGWLNDKNTSN